MNYPVALRGLGVGNHILALNPLVGLGDGDGLEELERIEAGNGVDGELLDTIRLIAAIMDGMRED